MKTRVRRFSISVKDDGNTSPAVEVNDPNCLGWELSFNTEAANKAMVACTIRAKDIWENGPSPLEYGPFFVGVGGKLYVPFPAFSITGVDAEGSGDGNTSTVRIVARTVEINGHSMASSEVIAFEEDEVGTSANVDFTVPKQATAFKVTNVKDGGNLSVSVSFTPPGGSEITVSQYAIKPGEVISPDNGAQGWRDLPNIPVGNINVANASGSDACDVTVWWKFDLRRVK